MPYDNRITAQSGKKTIFETFNVNSELELQNKLQVLEEHSNISELYLGWDNPLELYLNMFDSNNVEKEFQTYLKNNSDKYDVVSFYTEYGSFRNTDELSEKEQNKIDSQVFNQKENQCYYNAQTGTHGDIIYVEGYVIISSDSQSYFLPHAWLKINNKVVEITIPDGKQDNYVYYGFPYSSDTVNEALIERELADPLAEEPNKYPPIENN